jgi:hypothetical protein
MMDMHPNDYLAVDSEAPAKSARPGRRKHRHACCFF